MALPTLLCDNPSDIYLKHHFFTGKNLNFLTNLRSVSIHLYLPANSKHHHLMNNIVNRYAQNSTDGQFHRLYRHSCRALMEIFRDELNL